MVDNNKLSQAITIAEKYEDITIAHLQRKMRSGYMITAKLVEKMEEIGVLIPGDNFKRKVNHAAIKQWREADTDNG